MRTIFLSLTGGKHKQQKNVKRAFIQHFIFRGVNILAVTSSVTVHTRDL